MNKKTVLIALVVAAALTVVGVGAVRCAVSNMTASHDADPVQEPIAAEAQATDESAQTTNDSAQQQSVNTALEILTTHAWVAADGTGATLEFREGAWVESGKKLEATAFERVSESATSTQTILTVTPIRNGLAADPTALIISGKEGSLEVSSDAFALSRKYVQNATATTDFKVVNVDAKFYELAGTDEAALLQALSEYCAKRIPTATQASFDSEVFVNLKTGLCSATFHTNDASKTIVTVSAQSGKLTVAS